MPEDPEGALQQEDEPCVPLAAVGGREVHAPRTPRELSSKKMSDVCRWRQWEARRCTPEDLEGTLQQEDEPCVPLAAVGGRKMHA